MLLKQQLLRHFSRTYKLYPLQKKVQITLTRTNLKENIDKICTNKISLSKQLLEKVISVVTETNNNDHVVCLEKLLDYVNDDKLRNTREYLLLDIMTTNGKVYDTKEINEIADNYSKTLDNIKQIYFKNPQEINTFIDSNTFDNYTTNKIYSIIETHEQLFNLKSLQKIITFDDMFSSSKTFTDVLNKLVAQIQNYKCTDKLNKIIIAVTKYSILEYQFTNNNANTKRLALSIGSNKLCREWIVNTNNELYDKLKKCANISAVLTHEETIECIRSMYKHHNRYLENNTTSCY